MCDDYEISCNIHNNTQSNKCSKTFLEKHGFIIKYQNYINMYICLSAYFQVITFAFFIVPENINMYVVCGYLGSAFMKLPIVCIILAMERDNLLRLKKFLILSIFLCYFQELSYYIFLLYLNLQSSVMYLFFTINIIITIPIINIGVYMLFECLCDCTNVFTDSFSSNSDTQTDSIDQYDKTIKNVIVKFTLLCFILFSIFSNVYPIIKCYKMGCYVNYIYLISTIAKYIFGINLYLLYTIMSKLEVKAFLILLHHCIFFELIGCFIFFADCTFDNFTNVISHIYFVCLFFVFLRTIYFFIKTIF